LQIDESSKEARHLVILAMHESMSQITPAVESSPEPAREPASTEAPAQTPDTNDSATHH
jgi:hypothetical protein